MIDIQIVEQERQPGQPVTFMITIGCTSQPGLEAQRYDLICSIEARCTLSADDLDSPLDWIQDAGGYDQPCEIEFDPRTPWERRPPAPGRHPEQLSARNPVDITRRVLPFGRARLIFNTG
ncbi:MAG TPA: hypothetical protein PJ988_21660 [Anaerolinea sp.]|nr:hypothetical protein [Anaerolinea sp.]